MELVFRFAERITVLVGGRVLTEGTPAEIAADPRVKEVYLGEAAAWLSCCALDERHRRLWRRRWCSRTFRFAIERRRQPGAARAATASARPRCCVTLMGLTQLHRRRASAGAARDIARVPTLPARAGRPRLGAAGTLHVPVADGRGAPDRGRAARAVGRGEASTRCFRGCRSGAPTWATSCPAASSRCWRSRAR